MPKYRSKECKDAFLILHSAGWSGAAIGRVLSLSENTVRRWQVAEGLETNSTAYRPKFDNEIALALYDEGASDGEIARHFGATQSGALRWRQRKGLERNFDPNGPLPTHVARSAKRMLSEGASRRQVAEAHDIKCLGTIQKLRRKMPKQGMRRTGINNATIRAQVLKDRTVVPRIAKAVGTKLPADVKHDAVSSLYLAVLEGLICRDLIEEKAPRFRARAYALNGHDYSQRSLDDGDGRSWIDQLEDPTALARFENISWSRLS